MDRLADRPVEIGKGQVSGERKFKSNKLIICCGWVETKDFRITPEKCLCKSPLNITNLCFKSYAVIPSFSEDAPPFCLHLSVCGSGEHACQRAHVEVRGQLVGFSSPLLLGFWESKSGLSGSASSTVPLCVSLLALVVHFNSNDTSMDWKRQNPMKGISH